ncbi:hypothetical protein [Micavibrio aeruginosavorus]|uniref:hypothetical protein n=1 Tax=Micavibrio aeruginosavorus TaxID=349221 RepID=UPI003F4AB76A
MANTDDAKIEINVPYDVRGLIVTPLGSSRASDNYDHVRRFMAKVFFLPNTPENKKFRGNLREDTVLYIHSYMSDEDVARINECKQTITFEKLSVTFNALGYPNAVDVRTACQTPGTKSHIFHVEATRQALMGREVASPCDTCTCEKGTPKPPKTDYSYEL